MTFNNLTFFLAKVSITIIICAVFFSCKSEKIEYKGDFTWRPDFEEYTVDSKPKRMVVKSYKGMLTYGRLEPGELIQYYVNDYDENGKLVEQNIHQHRFGGEQARLLFQYNEEGNLSEINSYGEFGPPKKKQVFIEKGKKLIESIYSDAGDLNYKREFSLDADNCIIEFSVYLYTGAFSKVGERTAHTIQKCENGKVVESSDNFSGSNKLMYDSKNRLIKKTSKNWPASEYLYEDEDEHGNWCKRIFRSGNSVEEITYREITYYD